MQIAVPGIRTPGWPIEHDKFPELPEHYKTGPFPIDATLFILADPFRLLPAIERPGGTVHYSHAMP